MAWVLGLFRGDYITRPALSDERVQINAAGHVQLKLKTPWRDGALRSCSPAARRRMGRIAAAAFAPLTVRAVYGLRTACASTIGRHCPRSSVLAMWRWQTSIKSAGGAPMPNIAFGSRFIEGH
jgi:hypothetical protein